MSIDNFDIDNSTNSNGSGSDDIIIKNEDQIMSEITTAAFLNKGTSAQFK
jgi:hypothetical protein